MGRYSKNRGHGSFGHGTFGRVRRSVAGYPWNRGSGGSSQGFYRSRNSVLMGVCRGIAERFDLPVVWVRVAAVVMVFVSGFWPVIVLYFLAGFIIKPEPVTPIESQDEGDFYHNYVTSRKTAIRSLNSRFKSLEKKILRLEDTVTSREFDWDQKL